MKDRCYNPKNSHYHRYGGRGVRICERWLNSFEDFFADMGMCPVTKTIDRIDNNGNYSCGKCRKCRKNHWPMNCRWATSIEQANNRPQWDRKGAKHPNVKLTWKKVGWIRKQYRPGRMPVFARKFGVAVATISSIINLKTWKEGVL